VTTDPTSSGAQARKELGARLRQIRKASGLTGKAVAEATGQHVTRVSRVENGTQPPTERQIREWCTACGAADQIPDLLATARSVETAYLEWFRQSRAGMRRLGDLHSMATYQRTTTFRVHEPLVLPGIFQTEAYHRRVLSFLAECVRRRQRSAEPSRGVMPSWRATSPMTSCTATVSFSGITVLSARPANRHSVTSTSSW